MPRPGRVVLLGGGLAAGAAATALREHGYQGNLTLVAAEPHVPYERPPLSKGYLAAATPLEELFVQPPGWYGEHDVELLLGQRAHAVDLRSHEVVLDGGRLGFDRLLLATGASARRIAALEAGGVPVAYLRTVEDSDRIRAELGAGRRIAIVGGGWIGLEVAATARAAGCEVVLVEAAATPLERVLGAEVGGIFAALHRAHGVDLRTHTKVVGAARDGDLVRVGLDDGTTVGADLLVVGAGATPNVGLARGAGLPVEDGAVVDESLRSPHPDVYAAGDVASAFHPGLGRRLRVEHWDNAAAQGRTAALNLLGAGERYDRLPYFFTDQFDLGMEYVGHVGPEGYEETVFRGDPDSGAFTAFWVHHGKVVAGMHVNDWDAMDSIRAVVAARLDASVLRDTSRRLGDLVP